MSDYEKIITVTQDDLAWVSRKMISHIVMIKKSDLTDKEKNKELGFLAIRAQRFGLEEVVNRCDYHIIKIPGTEITLTIPNNINEADVAIIKEHLNILKGAIIIGESKKEQINQSAK